MKKAFFILFLFLFQLAKAQHENYITLSTKLVEAIQLQHTSEVEEYINQIATVDEAVLLKQLNSDATKKTFFINLYNSFVIYALRNDPSLYQDRGSFFSTKRFKLAGNNISLDNIEHDYLRHSSVKWGLGIFHKIFPSCLEKKLRVDKVDWRIHFSLNCGAKSCPPVFAYSLENIETEMKESSKKYLEKNTTYNKEKKELFVPVLMSWFRNDFGNKKGVKRICKEFNIIAENDNPSISYNSYDWTLDINNFRKN